ncbi:MAG: peptidylprolyl isomerase [Acidimicrobiales bacterium]
MPSDKRQRQRENAASRAAAARQAQIRAAARRRALIAGAAIVGVIALIAIFVAQSSGGGSKKKVSSAPPPSTAAKGATTTIAAATSTKGPPKAAPVAAGASLTGPTPCPAPDGTAARTTHFASAPPSCIDPSKKFTATFDTSEGRIVVDLDTKRTAGTVNNFIMLSRYHYYDKSSFDRIDTSIDIIQGGSPSTQSIADPGPGYTINDEGGRFTYAPGDLVMARSQGKNSGSAQYFFVTGPKASALDSQGTYVVFGHVREGLDVLQKVEGLYQACDPADQTCLGGAPSKVVLVNSVTITDS